MKIFKNAFKNQKKQELVLIHSAAINQVEDAFCTPPGSIVTQNGRFLYYFKMGSKFEDKDGESGHNIEALLMKFDLEEECELPDPIDTYTLHYTDLDNPLYIQFADDGYEFDASNQSFYSNQRDEDTFIEQQFVAIQYKISI